MPKFKPLKIPCFESTFHMQKRGKINKNKVRESLMSQSIPTGYIPPGNPRGLAQKTCPGGQNLTFESCPGTGNSTRAGIWWKMKLKLHKNSVNHVFTGENKKVDFFFFTFFEVYTVRVFLIEFFLSIFWFCCHT